MHVYYFAYGSNMNPARMAARGMRYVTSQSGWLPDWKLRFNKRADGKQGVAHANIVPSSGSRVEGVLYRLVEAEEIRRMDPYEGYPRLYGREAMSIHTAAGRERAWVYVATPAWQEEGLLPEKQYLNHLLSGRPWLTLSYFRALKQSPCHPR